MSLIRARYPVIVPAMTVPIDAIDVAIAEVEHREGRGPLPCSERSRTAHAVARIERIRRRYQLEALL